MENRNPTVHHDDYDNADDDVDTFSTYFVQKL